jgi:hypothetical protein
LFSLSVNYTAWGPEKRTGKKFKRCKRYPRDTTGEGDVFPFTYTREKILRGSGENR